MPVRIIVIIITTSSLGLGGVFLIVGAVYLLKFSTDGDRVPNTINTVTAKALCYPNISSFERSKAIAKQLDGQGVQYSEKRVKEIIESLDIVWLEKGADVKVTKESIPHYNPQLTAIFYRVEPINGPTRSCLISGNYLEMEFFEWVKWKWK